MFLKRWGDIPLFMKNEKVKLYYDILSKKRLNIFLKRLFDLVGSLVLMVILSPLMIIIAIFVKLDSKGPVFYRQERLTRYGKVFKILKFRTMIVNADKMGSLVTVLDDERITRLGNIIRKYRLDEIPQIFNIISGNMSFVGTRPEVKKYVDMYTEEMYATLLMPAGLTSFASIEFRDEDEIMIGTTEEEIDRIYIEKSLPLKMRFNLNYLKEFSIIRDVILCIKTII